jgi:hypothetical protein
VGLVEEVENGRGHLVRNDPSRLRYFSHRRLIVNELAPPIL